jgi:hypothetical protein
VIWQTKPVNAFFCQEAFFFTDFRLSPALLKVGLESQEIDLDVIGSKLAKVWEYLRLHERLFEAKIAKVKRASCHQADTLSVLTRIL